MRLRNLKNKEEIINNCEFVITDGNKYFGAWNKLFNNSNPIYIEIGMGMGKFIYENALNNPNINYIGIEKYDNVVARAVKKMEKLDNLFIIRGDARDIDTFFDKEIDKIYLNFSDPWPKKGQANRRLTSGVFLSKYDKLFRDNISIEMKTDNRKLFEYSIMSFNNNGYKIEELSFDLHSDSEEKIVTTEYEEKFINKGNSIYYISVSK